MLLLFIFCQLSVLVAANPFHKYPFVFLLDVGNEELEKTNSEQIRVSVPGGSVALRYPAIGYGNTIGHVRVSGIDFGTDLKANIIDGGPGYKYVVLVFIGNPGTPYDAVVTVKTVNENLNLQNTEQVVNSDANVYQNEDDVNNSAEDFSETENDKNAQSDSLIQTSNVEPMQSSSNVYSYVDNQATVDSDDETDEAIEESDDSDDNDEVPNYAAYSDESINGGNDEDGDADIHKQYADDITGGGERGEEVKPIDTDDDSFDGEEESSEEEQIPSDDYAEESAVIIDNNSYSKYEDSKSNLDYAEQYSLEDIQQNSKSVYREDPLDYEEPDDDDNNLENTANKYRDSKNNNHIDYDDSYAVAY